MKTLTRAETAAFLAERDHYIILTHNRPDGDTIGSAAALCLGLRSLGKTAQVLENRDVTPRFQSLHQGLTTTTVEPGDCVISVDVASPTGWKSYALTSWRSINFRSFSISFSPFRVCSVSVLLK